MNNRLGSAEWVDDYLLSQGCAYKPGSLREGSLPVEQDHRHIKQRLVPMLGLKELRDRCEVVIRGIELAWKIRKHQFRVGKLTGRPAARRGRTPICFLTLGSADYPCFPS